LAGMGDSLTTGTGARATKFEDNMIEYRGRSFRYYILSINNDYYNMWC